MNIKIKKIITYVLLFVAFFVCGIVLALLWGTFVSKKPAEQPVAKQAEHRSLPAPKTRLTSSVPVQQTLLAEIHAKSTPTVSPVQQTLNTELHANGTPTVSLSPALATAPAASTGNDIILLIDSSGSMKKTDPRSFRKEAAKLFIALLGAEDSVGIMSFGDSATLLMPLTRNTAQSRIGLLGAVDRISSRELTTNITDAVRNGFEELKSHQRRPGILILLSDGKIDLLSAEKDEASLAELKLLMTELKKENIRVYTVAFTEQSDHVLLERMAKETGGLFRFAKEDKDVHVMFSSIFEKIKSPDSIPFEGEAFAVDREITEATILATKKAGTVLTLLDPANRKYTASAHAGNITWFPSGVFDMITIQGPAAGTWRVKLSENEGNRVYVLTNLSLKTSWERSFVNRGEGATIDAWLEQKGRLIQEHEVLANTTFSAEVTGPDGRTARLDLLSSATHTGDQAAGGKYSAVLPVGAAGDYSVKLLAQGRTFKREKTITFKAVEPPAAATIKPSPAPAPSAPAPVPERGTVAWVSILLKWALVNLAVVSLIAAAYFIRNLLLKRKKKQEASPTAAVNFIRNLLLKRKKQQG